MLVLTVKADNEMVYDSPPPVKVGACRALSRLLPEAKKETVQPHIMGLFSALIDLLKQVIFFYFRRRLKFIKCLLYQLYYNLFSGIRRNTTSCARNASSSS